MRNVTDGKRQALQWSLTSTLDDLDYADDIGLLSNRHQDIQAQSDSLLSTAATIGLKMNVKKTKLMRKNTSNNKPVTINGNRIGEVNELTYHGNKITTDADSEEEINTKIIQATQAFAMLKTIW